ncbi:MAG: type II secretion system F family protein [Isosphaeraceae bacterium]
MSTTHLAQFCRQLAQYTNAGIPLLKSLSNLERQFEKTALGPVLGRIQQGVKQGDSLHEAMGREPAVFDKLFLGTMKVAEARGGVPEALRRLADHYEARQSLMRQARSAMIYPVIVLTIAGGVIALITVFVLPAMMASLEMKQANLPGPTRLLMGFSKFMQSHGWWAIPTVLVGSIVGLRQAYRTTPGKAALDELLLWIPVFGPLVKMIDTAQIARTLSVLLDAGIDAPSALNLTSDVVHLAPYRKAALSMEQSIREGSDLLEAMNDTRRFSADVIARVEAGEETGKLPESLDKLADDYDEQIALTVKNLGVLVQPLLMLILGGIVFFIALAFIMAYVSALQSASTL